MKEFLFFSMFTHETCLPFGTHDMLNKVMRWKACTLYKYSNCEAAMANNDKYFRKSNQRQLFTINVEL